MQPYSLTLRIFSLAWLALFSIDLLAQGSGSIASPGGLDGLTFLQTGRNTRPGGQAPGEGGNYQIDGTPFLYEDYRPGVLHFNTGKVAYAPLSFDVFNQRVSAKLQDGDYHVSANVIDGFDLVAPEGDTLTFQKVATLPEGITTGLDEEDFVEVLYQGEMSLVGNHRKNFLDQPASSTTYNNGRENPKYNDQPTHYYLLQPGKLAERVKMRSGWLRRYFDLSRKEVKSILKQAGAIPGTDAAAIAIVQHVDGDH